MKETVYTQKSKKRTAIFAISMVAAAVLIAGTVIAVVLLTAIDRDDYTPINFGSIIVEDANGTTGLHPDFAGMDGGKVSIAGYMSTDTFLASPITYIMPIPAASCPFCYGVKYADSMPARFSDNRTITFSSKRVVLYGTLEIKDVAGEAKNNNTTPYRIIIDKIDYEQ